MKLRLLSLVLLILMLSFASCGVVEPIFKAGMWWAFSGDSGCGSGAFYRL